jgi:hypothetical protein
LYLGRDISLQRRVEVGNASSDRRDGAVDYADNRLNALDPSYHKPAQQAQSEAKEPREKGQSVMDRAALLFKCAKRSNS